MNRPVSTARHSGSLEEDKAAAELLYASPAWRVIRQTLRAERARAQGITDRGLPGKNIQSYTNLKCLESQLFSERYAIRAMLYIDKGDLSIRFYFRKDELPEVEIKASTIETIGIAKITEHLDVLYDLQVELQLI